MSHAYLCGSALRVALELLNSQPQSVLRFCVLSGQKFFASVTFNHELKQLFVVRNFLRSGLLCGAGLRVALHARNSRFDLRLRFELRVTQSHNLFCVLRFWWSEICG